MNTKPRAPLLSSRTDWLALEIMLLFLVTVVYAVIIWRQESGGAETGLAAFRVTIDAVSPFSQIALICIVGLFELGGEIMLRYTAKIKQATEKGRADGLEEGLEKGRAEIYQAWHADWERRRQEAAEKGIPFTDPPPPNPTINGTGKL